MKTTLHRVARVWGPGILGVLGVLIVGTTLIFGATLVQNVEAQDGEPVVVRNQDHGQATAAEGLLASEESLPECPAGKLQALTPPSGPPSIAPIRACKSTPTKSISGPVKRPAGPRELEAPVPTTHTDGVWHKVGAYTGPDYLSGGYVTRGIWGDITVSNPSVPSGDNHFVASFFQQKQVDPPPAWREFIEVGWAEVGFDPTLSNKQVVFVYDSVNWQWHFFGQYTLQVGSPYSFAIQYQGANKWTAMIWWNGAWQPLHSHTFSWDAAHGTEENFEVYNTIIRDSPDQTDLPGGSPIWGRPTIILFARGVKLPPVHAIPLLSWRNYLLARRENSESPCPGRSSTLGRPICAGQPPCCHQCSPSHNLLPWHRTKLANPFQHVSQHLPAHQHFS
jgi:hypothetical protein